MLTQVIVEMSGISMTKGKGTVPKHWTLKSFPEKYGLTSLILLHAH